MRIPIEGEGTARREPEEGEENDPSEEEARAAFEEGESEAKAAASLEEGFAAKEAEVTELHGRWLRAQAELQNFKKRAERERARLREQATAEIIEQLLPVLDNLEKALSYSADRPEDNPLRQGLELIFGQLKEVLEEEGLAEIPAMGELFDPEVHEAVMTVEVDDPAADRVVEEFQKGYLFRGKLLRPSKVSVGKAKDPTA